MNGREGDGKSIMRLARFVPRGGGDAGHVRNLKLVGKLARLQWPFRPINERPSKAPCTVGE